ncbi:MAG: chromosome segregation protein SMC [Hyphomicrobiaceae bacterium]|nr:chromosome segregation protein SMC [Hyphomicrobiaceae bacterium]
MKISRLRLLGFKSFVEPVELLVEPGLTGVVGPNGCGKSNLLEALRWVMGETSHKSMRGAAMDDVIFAGTQNRPARNMAEVSIFIDNSERKAPAEFNDADQLEVTRRIEREAGSAFRINGKDVRARDVRLLFEDAATGARSPALVRQGRIGEIVNAKPQERRRILEDAAGIAGLHSRRHEAELRLKGAESNLERLQDLKGQLKTQLNSLKRQARQARRYKEISGDIRKSEALQHHLRWKAACEQVDTEETALEEAVRSVAKLTQDEAQSIREHTEAADAMQPLRDHEATRAAVLHRLTVEREALDEEEQRTEARKQELEDRLTQLEGDLERERDREQEAKDALDQLAREQQDLADAPDASQAAQAAREEMDKHAGELEREEEALTELTSRVERLRAEREQLTATLLSGQERIERLEARNEDEKTRLQQLEQTGDTAEEIAALREKVSALSEQATTQEGDALRAEEALANVRARERDIREQAKTERIRAQELETEAQTLAKLLKPADDVQWTPVLGETRVEPGYELALGAALGDDLDASDDTQAPAHWSLLGSGGADPALPAGTEPLSRYVSAPRSLARRLAQIGVVEAAQGAMLQTDLKPGQRLVSKAGDLWRWDGYAAAADAPTPAAKRLSERNRLDGLGAEAEAARKKAEEAEKKLAELSERLTEAEIADADATSAWRAVQAELGSARDALAAAEQDALASNKELAALAEARTRTREALEEAAETVQTAQQAFDALSSDTALAEQRESQIELVGGKRASHAEARSKFDSIEREQQIRRDRMASIAVELEKWNERRDSASQQIETLRDRFDETRGEVETFGDLPTEIADRRKRLLDEITKAESERNDAADALASADTLLREREKTMREAQSSLSETREERARVEARLEASRERRAEQARMISEQLECAPDECLSIAEIEPDAELPPLDELDAKVSRLKADRERLGGVNLAAEDEVGEIEQQLTDMATEQEDLEEAIARLRQGIAKLNREGRKRLLDAFDEVNDHFQRLFKTLFGGGEAELQLIESDDPLNSGLEILARPPGKKPQVLTLLSGGEKALTAMALIFAVFLTNPSPICVLDEVDAPLDDTNVERFCKMMEEMSKSTDTRFLIITHHPMTMARVDRLFGVTMAERGVSQLVSVDLETAEQYRDAG